MLQKSKTGMALNSFSKTEIEVNRTSPVWKDNQTDRQVYMG